jgi:hypothetical protein
MKEKYGITIGNNQPETDETDVSLDSHMSEQNSDDEPLNNEEETSNNSIKHDEKEENYMQQNDHESAYTPDNVSQASHVSHENTTSEKTENNHPDAYWKHGKWKENIGQ